MTAPGCLIDPGLRRREFGARLLLVAATLGTSAGGARAQSAGSCPEFWLLHTRACPQVLGTDPWPLLRALRLDPRGCFSRREPTELLARLAGRPVIVLVHGSYYTAEHAAAEGLRIRRDLTLLGAIPSEAVVVAFDWPSQLVYANPVRDANEKGRRAFIAGYHLARFLQAIPAGSPVGLIGHSHGGLATLAALHLLAGGALDDGGDDDPASCLPPGRLSLRIRAVVIEAACDRHWLDPGERLGRALEASEGVLCLYNRLDPALVSHPLGRHSDHRRALGRAGLRPEDWGRLGPLACRYSERDIAPLIGPRHTFPGTVSIPEVAHWIAPYGWTSAGPGDLD